MTQIHSCLIRGLSGADGAWRVCVYVCSPHSPTGDRCAYVSIARRRTCPLVSLHLSTESFSTKSSVTARQDGLYVRIVSSHHAVSTLSSSDQLQMQRIIEQKQMKDFMGLYSGLVERCFSGCINDFTSRALTTKETECVSHCTQKFLKHSERVGARFSEENARLMGQQQ